MRCRWWWLHFKEKNKAHEKFRKLYTILLLIQQLKEFMIYKLDILNLQLRRMIEKAHRKVLLSIAMVHQASYLLLLWCAGSLYSKSTMLFPSKCSAVWNSTPKIKIYFVKNNRNPPATLCVIFEAKCAVAPSTDVRRRMLWVSASFESCSCSAMPRSLEVEETTWNASIHCESKVTSTWISIKFAKYLLIPFTSLKEL